MKPRTIRNLLLLMLALTSLNSHHIARAQDSESSAEQPSGGMVVQLDAWWVTPQNVSFDYAFVEPPVTPVPLFGGGFVQTLEYDTSLTYRLYGAWKRDTASSPRLGAMFWEYDDSVTASTGELPDQIGAILASPELTTFGGVNNIVDSATAESRIRATQVDITLGWEPSRSRESRLLVTTGIRLFRYEEETVVTYLNEDFGLMQEESINRTSEAEGVGPAAGIVFDHRFGRRVWVGGQFGVALAVGEIESVSTDTAVVDVVDGDVFGATVVSRPGTDTSFLQFEGALRLGVQISAGWSVRMAYAFQHWSDVRLNQRFVDEASESTTIVEKDDAVFEGFMLGIRYEF